MKPSWVYILTNKNHTVLYVGVTVRLKHRITDHKNGNGSVFTKRYHVNKLVYFESHTHVLRAIDREKRIKGGSRARKIKLIESINPEWKDLYDEL